MSHVQESKLPSEGIREPVTVKAHLLGISPNGLRATVRFDTGDDHTTTVVLPSDAVIRKARGRRYDLLSTEQPKADIPLVITDADLHPDTARLVTDFAQALADKLLAAEMKYGYSNGWMNWDWMDECRDKLREHLAKGDPRDVAAYCAFLWFHGEPTAKKTEQAVGDVYDEIRAERRHQDEKWGGEAHDDEHGANDWLDIIDRLTSEYDHGEDARKVLVQIAAVAVAAIETRDRAAQRG